MYTLYIDTTSLGVLSVALGHREGLLSSSSLRDFEKKSTALFPLLDAVVQESGVSFDALDRIVVVRGPGPFTDVRLGISAALGFKYGRGSHLLGVHKVKVLHFIASCGGSKPTLSVLKACRKTFYVQRTLGQNNMSDPQRLDWVALQDTLGRDDTQIITDVPDLQSFVARSMIMVPDDLASHIPSYLECSDEASAGADPLYFYDMHFRPYGRGDFSP